MSSSTEKPTPLKIEDGDTPEYSNHVGNRLKRIAHADLLEEASSFLMGIGRSQKIGNAIALPGCHPNKVIRETSQLYLRPKRHSIFLAETKKERCKLARRKINRGVFGQAVIEETDVANLLVREHNLGVIDLDFCGKFPKSSFEPVMSLVETGGLTDAGAIFVTTNYRGNPNCDGLNVALMQRVARGLQESGRHVFLIKKKYTSSSLRMRRWGICFCRAEAEPSAVIINPDAKPAASEPPHFTGDRKGTLSGFFGGSSPPPSVLLEAMRTGIPTKQRYIV